MKKEKFTVLIPDGESEFAIKVLRCLSQVPNVTVHILSNVKWSVVRISKFRGKYFFCKTKEYGVEKVKEIITVAQEAGADVILPVDVPTIQLIAQYRDMFDNFAIPPLASPETINLAGDKALLARLLVKENMPMPNTIFYEDGDFDIQDLSKLNFPVLTKLTNKRGGGGISQYSTAEDLGLFWRKQEHQDNFIVQSFVNGYDMCCSVLCKDGEVLAFTMQKEIIPPYSRFTPPAGVEYINDEVILNIIKKLMRSLNWSGVANVDIRYDQDEMNAKILEINPRFFGSLIGSLIAGVNFPYLTCLLAFDAELPELDYKVGNYYIHHKAAMLLVTQRFFSATKFSFPIVGTGIEYVLHDPLPELFNFFSKILSNI